MNLECPNCHQLMAVADHLQGTSVACPFCHAVIQTPPLTFAIQHPTSLAASSDRRTRKKKPSIAIVAGGIIGSGIILTVIVFSAIRPNVQHSEAAGQSVSIAGTSLQNASAEQLVKLIEEEKAKSEVLGPECFLYGMQKVSRLNYGQQREVKKLGDFEAIALDERQSASVALENPKKNEQRRQALLRLHKSIVELNAAYQRELDYVDECLRRR